MVKVEQNQIYCLIPFSTTSQFPDPTATRLWKESSPVLDPDAMYRIACADNGPIHIYALNLDENKMLGKLMRMYMDSDDIHRFKIMNEKETSWRTPHLILNDVTGLLIIPFELTDDVTVDDVMNFVNKVHKYDSGQRLNFNIINKSERTLNEIDNTLQIFTPGHLHTWSLTRLIDLLLSPIDDSVEFHEYFRAHMLTYMLVDNDEKSLTDENKADFLRIMHRMNHKYKPLIEEFDRVTTIKTFDNIYLGASIEGSCMMGLLMHDESDGFMQSYPVTTFQSRFMWFYIKSYMQRHSLLYINNLLSDTIGKTDNDKYNSKLNEQFRSHVARVCALRLSNNFTGITTYTHLNKIYSFLIDRFEIRSLHEEINDKLKMVNTWLDLNNAAGREHFERIVQMGGIILALLAILYTLPQTIQALKTVWMENMWDWALVSFIPAIFVILAYIIWKISEHTNKDS